mmetsp:Transcript_13619/g.30566  ORF Transcript_13619/g.30566 Transcript_13619/m.30566 type:complete len:258 (+) Transcript_13619:1213-1986(+)
MLSALAPPDARSAVRACAHLVRSREVSSATGSSALRPLPNAVAGSASAWFCAALMALSMVSFGTRFPRTITGSLKRHAPTIKSTCALPPLGTWCVTSVSMISPGTRFVPKHCLNESMQIGRTPPMRRGLSFSVSTLCLKSRHACTIPTARLIGSFSTGSRLPSRLRYESVQKKLTLVGRGTRPRRYANSTHQSESQLSKVAARFSRTFCRLLPSGDVSSLRAASCAFLKSSSETRGCTDSSHLRRESLRRGRGRFGR